MRAGVCGNSTRRMRRQRTCGAPRSETAHAPGAQLTALRDSLRVRLPLLISAVIAVGLATSSLPMSPPSLTGLGQFRAWHDAVFYEAVAEVRDDPRATSRKASPRRLGYVREPRTFSGASTSDLIGRLVGNGAALKLGNQ